MKTTEVTTEIIGHRCECIFTAKIITGVIEDIRRTEYSTDVKVRFDEPQQWGEDIYRYEWCWARRIDEFGTLQHLKLLTEVDAPNYQTRIVTFGESISRLDGFFDDPQMWGASTLKEWVDHYESTRFTQITENSAVITSEYNIENVMEWLNTNTPIIQIR